MKLTCTDCGQEFNIEDGVFNFGVFYCKTCYRDFNNGIMKDFPIVVTKFCDNKQELEPLRKDGSFAYVSTKKGYVLVRMICTEEDTELYFRINSTNEKVSVADKDTINKGYLIL